MKLHPLTEKIKNEECIASWKNIDEVIRAYMKKQADKKEYCECEMKDPDYTSNCINCEKDIKFPNKITLIDTVYRQGIELKELNDKIEILDKRICELKENKCQ